MASRDFTDLLFSSMPFCPAFLSLSYLDEQLAPWLDLDPLSWLQGPHFAAVNSNNEIIVTDFHNHSVKVSAK